MDVRDQLCGRFDRGAARALADVGAAPGHEALRLPPALRESLAAAAELSGGACPEALSAFYCEAMPRLRVDQLGPRGPHGAGEGGAELLFRTLELERLPRLRTALGGLFRVLGESGFDAASFLGGRDAAAVVAKRPTIAQLYAPTLFGSGLPMVGAYPVERKLLARELAAGTDPDALLDLRLSGNLIHELCHGPQVELTSAPCWHATEAAALQLGSHAFPRHVYPDLPGEAVPGVSLFTLIGEGLERIFGRRALLSLLVDPRPLREALSPAAAALEVAGHQDFLRRREPPFARDALDALSWVKLAALCAEGARPPAAIEAAAGGGSIEAAQRLPSLIAAAAEVSWKSTPWWSGPADERDQAMVATGVRALFQKNVFAETFQTHPAELYGGTLRLDVERCELSTPAKAGGVFGEPARWIFPAPLARGLWERGVRRVVVQGARRAQAGPIAAALIELAQGKAELLAEVEIRWTSSS